MSKSSISKPLQLWFCSRSTALILSGMQLLTNDNKRKIYEMTGIRITQDDVDKFPKILSRYGKYCDVIYRGVFSTDELYIELITHNRATTNRYYSCTSEKYIGKLFGSKILLIITGCLNFDVRHVSREKEIILDKFVDVVLESRTVEDGYEILFIRGK